MHDNNEPMHEPGLYHKASVNEQSMQWMPSPISKQGKQD